MDSIDNSQIELMVYNIFPSCNTALHYVSQKQNVIKQIYNHSENPAAKFEIPFIINLYGESPIHVCMANKEFKTVDFYL